MAVPEPALAPSMSMARTLLGWYRDGLPERVLREGRRCLLNAAAVGMAGAQTVPARALATALATAHGDGRVPVIGRPEAMAPPAAATVTAFSVTQDDFDDAHVATIVHPGAAALAGLLHASTHPTVTGRELLTAFTLGAEAQLAVATAISPSHYEIGWHSTATCAAVGSATVAGLALGLNASELAAALDLAMLRVVGLRESHGTLSKGYQVGRNAANGVAVVHAARAGITGLPPVIGRHDAFRQAITRERDPIPVIPTNDTDWRLLELTYKPYPAGIVCNSGIEAALGLAGGVDADSITAIRLRVHPLVADLAGNRSPTDDMQARVSLPHGVAAALLTGLAGPDQFDQAAVDSPAVRRLRDTVEVIVDAGIPRVSAELEVDTGSGTVRARVDRPRGGTDRPLTDSELRDKARGVLDRFGPGVASALLRAVQDLDTSGGSGALVRAACRGTAAPTVTASLGGGSGPGGGDVETAVARFVVAADPPAAVLGSVTSMLTRLANRGGDAPAARAVDFLAAHIPGGESTSALTWPGSGRLERVQVPDAGGEGASALTRPALALPVLAASAALAVDRSPGADGGAVRAACCGIEVAVRVGTAFRAPPAADRWDAEIIGATVGAAAAAAAILGLGVEKIIAALGFAAVQASTMSRSSDTVTRTLLDWAATGAVEAALAARAGLAGPGRPLSGPRGLFAVHGLLAPAEAAMSGLGTDWICAPPLATVGAERAERPTGGAS